MDSNNVLEVSEGKDGRFDHSLLFSKIESWKKEFPEWAKIYTTGGRTYYCKWSKFKSFMKNNGVNVW